MVRKRSEASDRGDNAIVAYMHEVLSPGEGSALVSISNELQYNAFNMQMSLPVEGSDLYKIGLKDLHVMFDEVTSSIHIRRYWSNRDGQMRPHRRGVCMSTHEFVNFILAMEEMVGNGGGGGGAMNNA